MKLLRYLYSPGDSAVLLFLFLFASHLDFFILTTVTHSDSTFLASLLHTNMHIRHWGSGFQSPACSLFLPLEWFCSTQYWLLVWGLCWCWLKAFYFWMILTFVVLINQSLLFQHADVRIPIVSRVLSRSFITLVQTECFQIFGGLPYHFYC